MYRQQTLDRFYFDNYTVIQHKIHAVAAFQLYAFVEDRQRKLATKWHLVLSNLITQALLVGGFQQTGA